MTTARTSSLSCLLAVGMATVLAGCSVIGMGLGAQGSKDKTIGAKPPAARMVPGREYHIRTNEGKEMVGVYAGRTCEAGKCALKLERNGRNLVLDEGDIEEVTETRPDRSGMVKGFFFGAAIDALVVGMAVYTMFLFREAENP